MRPVSVWFFLSCPFPPSFTSADVASLVSDSHLLSFSFTSPSVEAGGRPVCGADYFLVSVFSELWDGRFLSCYQRQRPL